jgi:hypothetical protein
MKKILILAVFTLGLNLNSNAQSILSKATSAVSKASTAASIAGVDVNSLTSGILGKLAPALALTAVQKPKVTTIVKDFLVQKATALATQKTNASASASKVSSLVSGLPSKLGTVLTVAQLTKFTSLKPTTASATNVLSQLFY